MPSRMAAENQKLKSVAKISTPSIVFMEWKPILSKKHS